MKTMLDLLIGLQRTEITERAARAGQLTPKEKQSLRIRQNLIREVIPDVVLSHYEEMKRLEPDLMECPAVFAMAVLVAAYRELPRGRRETLKSFFASRMVSRPLSVSPRMTTASPHPAMA